MKAVICEDNPYERKILKSLITESGINEAVELENAQGLSAVLASYRADIVFLDINMPGISGLEAAKAIRKHNTECFIVFITAFDQYALEAFSVYAFDYIVKPINPSRLKDTLNRIINAHKVKALDRLIDIKYRQTISRVRLGDIILVEKQFHKCFIFTKDFEYEANSSISKIEKNLDSSIFIRTHSGYIVNRLKILKIVPNNNLSYTIYLADTNKVAYVSRSRRHLLENL